MADSFKYNFQAAGASDDLGYIDGATINGEPVDESEGCHNWFELLLDGQVIGQCMMNYSGGWEFQFRSDTHQLQAGKHLCAWNETPPRPESDSQANAITMSMEEKLVWAAVFAKEYTLKNPPSRVLKPDDSTLWREWERGQLIHAIESAGLAVKALRRSIPDIAKGHGEDYYVTVYLKEMMP